MCDAPTPDETPGASRGVRLWRPFGFVLGSERVTRIRTAAGHCCQAWRPPARTAHDDQLLLEQKILRDHRSHATGATQCRGHDGPVKQGEQEGLHARDSVGQTSGATPRDLNPRFSERIGNSRRTQDSHSAHTNYCFRERMKKNGESTSVAKPSTESDQAQVSPREEYRIISHAA